MAQLITSVVSLQTAAERRQNISSQLDPTGLDWSFFDAETSVNPNLTVHTDKLLRINGRPLMGGEFGCYSSHWSLWKAHSERPAGDVLLVFEDDAIIDPFFFGDIANLIRLGNKYGVLRLGGHLTAPSEEVEILGRRRIVRFKKRIHGTLSYLIDVPSAKMLAAKFTDVYRPIDVEYDRFWAHGRDIYCVYPFPAIESYKESQLGERANPPLPRREFLMWKALNALEKLRRYRANLFRRIAK